MSEYFIYYTESSIVCLIIFGIMLIHDIRSVDRQEKQIKYDYALMAFMAYFVSDAFWAAIIGGVIPRTVFSVALTNFTNFIFLAAITYSWLHYVMAVEKVESRNRPVNVFAIAFPLIVSVLVLIVTYIIDPRILINDELEPTALYSLFQVFIPIIYIGAILFYSIRRSRHETNPLERRKFLFLGFFPLAVVVGGLFQIIILPDVPVFCFCCTIMMLIFYIQSMDGLISVDPLTGLNNRGQLMRYISQEDSLFREGSRTYVVMMDVNDFKKINDTYGHAEGDHALRIISEALKRAAGALRVPVFIGRYGGDEFVLIVHSSGSASVDRMIHEIRSQIDSISSAESTGYSISVAIGFDELKKSDDSFTGCLQRADSRLYEDKRLSKQGV